MRAESGKLPAGWAVVTAGEVAEIKLGKMLDRTKHTSGKALPYLRNINVRWGSFDTHNLLEMFFDQHEIARYSVESGDLVVCEGGEPGRAAIWRESRPAMFQKALHRVRSHGAVTAEWLLICLRYYVKSGRLKDYVSGSTIKHFTRDSFTRLPIQLPPLPEQQRIVARLAALEARSIQIRAQLLEVPVQLEQVRQSLLAAAFRGVLTADWRKEVHDFEPISQLLDRTHVEASRTGRSAGKNVIPGVAALSIGDPKTMVPNGWLRVPLLQIAQLASGHTPSREHPEYWGGDVPWISIPDARRNHGRTITDTASFTNKLGLENSAARLLPKGTVCLSRTASVGYSVVMGRPMATSQDFANWICSPAIVPEFLMLAFLAEGSHLLRFGKGTTHTTIYYPELKALHITLPPVAEQLQIVSRLNAAFARLDAVTEAQVSSLRDLDQFDQVLLDRAFSGSLVPQDLNEEPVSILLQRIKDRRATETPPPKSTRKLRPPKMNTLSQDTVRKAILGYPKKEFSFSDLRTVAPSDYESLKNILFQLLAEKKPVARQVFNAKTRAMQFQRIET